MDTFDSSSKPENYQLYMQGKLEGTEQIKVIFLRDEKAYDLDRNPRLTAAKSLAVILKNLDKKPFLIWASEELAKSTPLRKKRFEVTTQRIFKEFNTNFYEVFVEGEISRLICIVELNNLGVRALPVEALNSAKGVFLLTPNGITELEIEKLPLRTDYGNSVYDIKKILSEFVGPKMCLIRYFPADNGRDESAVCIGMTESNTMIQFT